MSLITSCPACATMFRVVPDQLKISEGWVRCGHCGEVFDATAHLADEASLALARGEERTRPAEVSTVPGDQPAGPAGPGSTDPRARERISQPATVPAALAGDSQPATLPASLGRDSVPPTVPAPLATRPAELASRPGELPTVPPRLAARAGERAGPPSSGFGADSQPLEPSPLDSPFVFRRSDLRDPGDSSVLPPPPRDSQLPREELEEPTPAELGDVSFVRQARRKAFWRQPTVRILLSLVSLGLAALLVLQFAWHDRDRLALAEPALRPALERMCELLRCTLGAPRQIESIVIDNSGFNRLRNDTYRLGFTLRNTGSVPVAVPAMELTITDGQDQPVARRVLLPEDFGSPGAAIPPAGEWSRTVGIVMQPPGSTRVAGYRLLAFYP